LVDDGLILRKLAELERYLQQVAEYRSITIEDYQADWKTQRIVERTLQLAFEACADIGNHVIADRRLEVPRSYAGVFETLGRAGLLDRDLSVVMARMAGFRNVLVHEYANVDAEVVVRVLREHLSDFERFKAAALGWR
jgi:uncharacterized protein YutE (UPF0331/DUF86 family)